MNVAMQILLTLVLVAAALWAYDGWRETPQRTPTAGEAGSSLEAETQGARIDALAAQLRILEARVATLRAAAPAPAGAPEAQGPMDEAEMNRLEAVVREIERREDVARVRASVQARLQAMALGLSEAERAKVVPVLVRIEAERADFWRVVRQEALRDQDAIRERYAPIRARGEQALRAALPKPKARVLIDAFLGKPAR